MPILMSEPYPEVRLDELPVDVLLHVATFCTPESVWRMCGVSRYLRQVYYDPKVFKKIITDSYMEKQSRAFQLLCQHLDLDTEAWARYAAASARASLYDFSRAWTWQVVTAPRGFEAYLPQMLVTGCCDPNNQRGTRLLDIPVGIPSEVRNLPGQKRHTYLNPSHDARLNFCHAAILISLETKPPQCFEFDTMLNSLPSTRVTYADGLQDGGQWKLHRIIGAFANKLATIQPQILQCPNISNIPFASFDTFCRLPLPFERDSSDSFLQWLRYHTQQMVKPEFITAGEWCGYYSNDFGITSIDPPLRNIRFRVNSSRVSPENSFALSATGEDVGGRFTMNGSMSNTGLAQFRKQYREAHGWNLFCSMTPFGICGVWRHPEHVGQGGLLWMWPCAWSDL